MNIYGVTEATINSSFLDLTGRDLREAAAIPLGRAVPNVQLYVLDENYEPLPIGAIGEVFIGGHGVSRGYVGRPSLTAERFIPSPFRKTERLYRTGDLGRGLSDGAVDFSGRNDFQVKIRGFRVELGEIEKTIADSDGVCEVVVLAREGADNDRQLVAYYVTERGGGDENLAEKLRRDASKSLLDHMVPAAFVPLKEMPLTPNGKLDRARLPEPRQEHFPVREYSSPRDEIEAAVAEIWEEILSLDRIGREDNFFEIGGHSLLAIKVMAKMRAKGLTCELEALFNR